MKIKKKLPIVDIIGISLIFIVLFILVVPVILVFAKSLEKDNTTLKARSLYESAKLEYDKDVEEGRVITTYCYRSDYGYPLTLNDGTAKSIVGLNNGSYYITFDEFGNMSTLVFIDVDNGIKIEDTVTKKKIMNISGINKIKLEEANEIINHCPYNSN